MLLWGEVWNSGCSTWRRLGQLASEAAEEERYLLIVAILSPLIPHPMGGPPVPSAVPSAVPTTSHGGVPQFLVQFV